MCGCSGTMDTCMDCDCGAAPTQSSSTHDQGGDESGLSSSIVCPMCCSIRLTPLGTLGVTKWFRCRQCGTNVAKNAEGDLSWF